MKLRTLVFVNKIDSAFNFPLMKSYTANKIKTQYLKPQHHTSLMETRHFVSAGAC